MILEGNVGLENSQINHSFLDQRYYYEIHILLKLSIIFKFYESHLCGVCFLTSKSFNRYKQNFTSNHYWAISTAQGRDYQIQQYFLNIAFTIGTSKCLDRGQVPNSVVFSCFCPLLLRLLQLLKCPVFLFLFLPPTHFPFVGWLHRLKLTFHMKLSGEVVVFTILYLSQAYCNR